MKLLKKEISKKILIAVVVLILVVEVGISYILLNKDNKEPKQEEMQPGIKEVINKTVSLKEKLIFEINSELTLLSLIDENNEVEIISEDEVIDTSVLGKKELIIKYKDNGEEKEYKFEINVIDTTAPTIEYESKLSTTQGTEIDLLKDVKVSDNSNEEIKATVEGTYNFNKSGEYKLKYVAIDSSENKIEEEFVLKVKAKSSSNKKENDSNTNNSESNNTANNNSNINNTNDESSKTPSADSNTSSDTNDNKTEEKQEENVQPPEETIKRVTEYRQTEARKMLALINNARKENGLNELKLNTSLENSAKIRAKEIVTLFSHTRPNGEDPFSTITVDYFTAGENIAAGQPSVEKVFESWMNSPGHRANILNAKFTDIGISWYYDSESEYRHNWVQLFIGQ